MSMLALTVFLPASMGFVLHAPAATLSAGARSATPVMYLKNKPMLRISGINIDVTKAMHDIAEMKVAAPLSKFASVLNDGKAAELHLKVENQFVHDKKKQAPRQTYIAEVTAHLKGSHRTVVVRSESEDNIYMAVDSLETLLSRKLRKAKDQKIARNHKGDKSGVDAGTYDADEENDEDATTTLYR